MKKSEIYNFINKNAINLILILLIFLLVLFLKINYADQITSLDKTITAFINDNIQSPILTKLMLSITFLGSFTGLALIIIVSFFIFNNKKISLFISINLLVVHLLNRLLKYVYDRPRPEFILIKETGSSLPSGHAMCSIAFYGLLIYLNNKYVKKGVQKTMFNVFLIALIMLIGFSRIYLNVHYFTDIVVGYAFGLLSLFIFINVIESKEVKLWED